MFTLTEDDVEPVGKGVGNTLHLLHFKIYDSIIRKSQAGIGDKVFSNLTSLVYSGVTSEVTSKVWDQMKTLCLH